MPVEEQVLEKKNSKPGKLWRAAGVQYVFFVCLLLGSLMMLPARAAAVEDHFPRYHLDKAEINENKLTGLDSEGQPKVEIGTDDKVSGAAKTDGEVSGGSLIVRNSTLSGVYGAYSDEEKDGGVTKSRVFVYDSTIQDGVYGGYKDGTEASSNQGDVKENLAVLIESKAYAAYGGFTWKGEASGNMVKLFQSIVTDVYGGFSWNGEATSNVVLIEDSTVTSVVGGYGMNGASNNTVIISGTTLTGGDGEDFFSNLVLGGYSSNGSAINNTVNITGATQFGNGVSIYGGFSSASDDQGESHQDLITGNVLNYSVNTAQSVSQIGNFSSINISVPMLTAEYRDDAYITINGGESNFSETSVSINVLSVQNALDVKVGDRFKILTNENGLNLTSYTVNTSGITDASQLLAYDMIPEYYNEQSLDLVVRGWGASEQSKVLSEAHAAGGALVLSGADLVAGPGIDAAKMALLDKEGAPYGLAIFATISGSSMRYETGSHVDLRSLSLVTGPVLGVETAAGALTMGAFFEFGTGSYGVEHDMSGPEINGDGYLSYTGGGVLLRMDFIDLGSGHIYVEGSGRAGTLTTDFSSSDSRLKNKTTGVELEYDMSLAYQSLHGEIGYVWNVTPEVDVDIYGQYLWSRIFGEDTTTSTGALVGYEDFYSSRTRVGARISYVGDPRLRFYAGAAWEHEFDGKARATVAHNDVKSADLLGSTGIGELGLTWTAAAVPFTIDFNVQGHTGVRQGVSGNLLFEYRF